MCAILLAALALSACSDQDPAGPEPATGFLRARIGDFSWAADSQTVASAALRGDPGLFVINGRPQADGYGLVLQLFNIGGPGTYPLGVGAQMFGGLGTVSQAPSSLWTTPPSGAAGRIEISALSEARIEGTFSFSADAFTGSGSGSGATGRVHVTEGAFDLPIVALAPGGALPENAGSALSGTLGVAAFNASSAALTVTGRQSPVLTIVGENTNWLVLIRVSAMTGPGTYTISATDPARLIQVTAVDQDSIPTWSSTVPGGSGTVMVTSSTNSRIQGTFAGTLPSAIEGASEPIQVSGSFNMARP